MIQWWGWAKEEQRVRLCRCNANLRAGVFYPTVIREALEILHSSVCEINLTVMEDEFE